jgi:peptidyl-prolyl cis-trans isomerase SurA
MKSKLILCALAGTALVALAAKDPVLMRINGKDVKLSEFEYLYKKNNQQQVQQETLDQYVDRFITYKLKVADAEAHKIDTLESFQKEFDGYKADLVKPFLTDGTVQERLVNEAYERMKYNVDVDHIMLPLGKDKAENNEILARLDSIRNCVLNGEDFYELAQKFSIDPSMRNNKGHYGFIPSGVFPYVWEYEAFNTPIGQMCKPFRTDFGNHLIRVNGRRDDPGKVEVEHILRLYPRGANDSAKAVVKEKIDSIYTALMNGADFEELAKVESQDPGSAKNGGKLPLFGINRMVKPFEEMAFKLNDGELSAPFETNYGWHIMKKLSHKGVPTLEEARKGIETMISRDERANAPREAKLKEAMAFYNYKENPKFAELIQSELTKHGQYDSAFVADVLKNSNFPICEYANGKTIPASEIAKKINPKAKMNNDAAKAYILSEVEPIAKNVIMKYYVDNLINDNVEYRNLINEYRDGMLLFEISNQRVWEGASKDTVGLRNYFEANRKNYNWEQPHFKGIILSAKNDSILQVVKADIPNYGVDTLTNTLHKKYARDIKMERMLFGPGENDVVDRIVFNKPVEKEETAYPVGFILQGGLINAPEDYTDVKGQVTSDYQDVIEKKWIEELRKKYPVQVFKKVLKMVKK